MNRGHEVGCAARRNGVPCTCWMASVHPPLPLKQAIVSPNGKIQKLERQVATLERQVHELTVEWRGLQDMAGDQRKYIIELENAIALTGESSGADVA